MQLFEGCTNLAKKGKECILYLTRGAKVQGETVQALEGVYRPSQEMGGVWVMHGEQRFSDEVFSRDEPNGVHLREEFVSFMVRRWSDVAVEKCTTAYAKEGGVCILHMAQRWSLNVAATII